MPPSPHALRRATVPAALGLLAAFSLIRPALADACTLATAVEHEIDPDDPDAVAPANVSLVSVDVHHSDDSGACGSHSTCGRTGRVSIVVRAEDDATPPESIGFTIELVSGSLPRGLSLPDQPIRGYARDDGTVDVVLVWSADQADSMDFVVKISAVDRAGNVGDSTPVAVVHEEEGGCSLGGDVPGPATAIIWLVAALAALLILRARRPASAPPAGG